MCSTKGVMSIQWNVSISMYICLFRLMFQFSFATATLVVAMSSIVDSRAHFDKRCAEFGLSGRAIQQLRHHGYDTLGKLALSGATRCHLS